MSEIQCNILTMPDTFSTLTSLGQGRMHQSLHSLQNSFSLVCVCVCVCEVTQLCPTLCDPMACSPPGSSVHGILQARILEWVAISFSLVALPKTSFFQSHNYSIENNRMGKTRDLFRKIIRREHFIQRWAQ